MRNGCNDKGFTLLEILVAVTLLTIGLLGVAGLTVGIMRGNIHSNIVTTATTLAQDRMEEIRKRGYDNVDTTTFPDEDYNTITNFPFYKRVTSIAVGPSVNMKTVTITVSWDGGASSVALVSILGQ